MLLLLPEEVESHWILVESLLAKGIDSLELEVGDLKVLAEQGHVQLWLMSHRGMPVLAMATQFLYYPRRKTMHILAFGGSRFRAAQQFWPKVEDFILRNDCVVVTALCEDKLSRLLRKRFGFIKRYDFVERRFHGRLH